MSLNGEIEPADPQIINHMKRRETRIAEPTFDCDRLPDPLVEHTDNKRLPMRLRDARDIYLKLSKHNIDSDDKTSRLERLRNRYGRVMNAERELLDQLDNPSVLFLSLRQSPIRTVDGVREWIRPVRLCTELNESWSAIAQMLRRKLSGYDRYEYVRTTGYTDNSATPHYHIMIYVEDPCDQLQPDVGESLVDSFVRGNDFASHENHSVDSHERDASILKHQIPLVDTNSTFLKYSLGQSPHWILSEICNGNESSVDEIKIDAGTVSWSQPYRDYSSSREFPDGV
jgi:hypothetical protein